jgi:hypothetical protein
MAKKLTLDGSFDGFDWPQNPSFKLSLIFCPNFLFRNCLNSVVLNLAFLILAKNQPKSGYFPPYFNT